MIHQGWEGLSITEPIDLKKFAKARGITLKSPTDIFHEATDKVIATIPKGPDSIKNNFDYLIEEIQNVAFDLYKRYQLEFGKQVFIQFFRYLIENDELTDIKDTGKVLSKYFMTFDRFFLSLSQSRKIRAGSTFEKIHTKLFMKLNYPFDPQCVINGKPDFLMPSEHRFRKNPMDCIIFTAKRTLRERWRQIVTEGIRGLGFYLATIDTNVSEAQLKEMLDNRIYLVVPENIKNMHYHGIENVLSFKQFFRDHLDPKMEQWKRKGYI